MHPDLGTARNDFLELAAGMAQLNKGLEAQSVLLVNLMKDNRVGWMTVPPHPMAAPSQGAIKPY